MRYNKFLSIIYIPILTLPVIIKIIVKGLFNQLLGGIEDLLPSDAVKQQKCKQYKKLYNTKYTIILTISKVGRQ